MVFFNLLFSIATVAFAEQSTLNNKIIDVEGTTIHGGRCDYSAFVMHHWEGQIAIFLHWNTARFHIEFPSSELPLKNGKVQAIYPGDQLYYENGTLTYEYRTSNGSFDEDEVEIINIDVDPSLRYPRAVRAVHKIVGPGNEENILKDYECFFKDPKK